jgi:hypothetical protein
VFGAVFLEAACGVPVIGSKVDGSREALLDGQLGRPVDPNVPEELVGLDLIFLLIGEHASDTSQAMAADESVSDQARQMAKLDLAMDETVRRQACELADTFDAPAQLEDTVTLAPRDAIPTADGAVARRTQHTGAVIIRDPRQHLTRGRTLGDGNTGDRRDF